MIRKITLIWLLLNGLCANMVMGQSKLYIDGGISSVIGSGTNLLFGSNYSIKLKYKSLDVEYEKRLIGSFSMVTGASLFTAGYVTTDGSFSSLSEFKATYVAVPLLARWNVGNRNFFYLDFGLVPYFLLRAHLTESIRQFNNKVTVEGDVTPYSNRFYFASKIQMIYCINRFNIGLYFVAPAKGQSSIKNLGGNWGLNNQQSTYLLSNGFSDYFIMGIKTGWRIK